MGLLRQSDIVDERGCDNKDVQAVVEVNDTVK